MSNEPADIVAQGYEPGVRLRQNLDVPVRAVHADALAVADQAGGVLHAYDGGQAVLPRDHGAVVIADVAAQQGAALHATGP